MEFHQIRYFQAVAESRSFTAAAKREHVSQPTLSHQVLKLESELGAKLFHRMGRKVELTAFGEVFLPKAETILRELKLAKAQIREMAGAETGSVAVGVIPTITPFFMPELLSQFLKQHPGIEIKVVEEASVTLLDWLREGVLDAAIVPMPVHGKWASSTELLSEHLYAVVADGHPLCREKQVTLKQLSGARFLFLKDGNCFREEALATFRMAKIEPHIIFETGCFLTILNMVKAGVGISVVPEMAIGEDSGCIFVPICGDRPVRVIALAESKQRVATRAQQLFVNFVKQAHRIGSTTPEKPSRSKSKAASRLRALPLLRKSIARPRM